MVVRSPCQENYPADAHPSAHKSVLESANPAWSVHLDTPGQRHVSGTADPGVVKQDKSSGGSVDTTKTRSDPQRVRMSSGERPIGAAKGKQPDTEALCETPPRHPPILWQSVTISVTKKYRGALWTSQYFRNQRFPTMALYIHRDMSLAALPPTPRVARKLDPSLHPSGAGGVQMGRGAAKGVRGVPLGGGGGGRFGGLRCGSASVGGAPHARTRWAAPTGAAASQCVTPRGVRQVGGL